MIYDLKNEKSTPLIEWDLSPSLVIFTPCSTALIAQAEERGHNNLYRIDLATKSINTLVSGGFNQAPSIAANNWLIYAHDSFHSPPEIHASSLDFDAQRILTNFNKSRLNFVILSEAIDVRFTGGDGDEVQSWLFPPITHSANELSCNSTASIPLLLIIHGGPQSAITVRSPAFQFLIHSNFFFKSFFNMVSHPHIVDNFLSFVDICRITFTFDGILKYLLLLDMQCYASIFMAALGLGKSLSTQSEEIGVASRMKMS